MRQIVTRVIPAKAGIQAPLAENARLVANAGWIPARASLAGMTAADPP